MAACLETGGVKSAPQTIALLNVTGFHPRGFFSKKKKSIKNKIKTKQKKQEPGYFPLLSKAARQRIQMNYLFGSNKMTLISVSTVSFVLT